MCDPRESLGYPIDDAFKLLGHKWYSEVLLEFSRGASRYSDLQKALPRISPRTLSMRLAELRAIGVISAKPRNNNTVTYEFTDKGRELIGLVNSIAAFSLRWHSGTER